MSSYFSSHQSNLVSHRQPIQVQSQLPPPQFQSTAFTHRQTSHLCGSSWSA